MTLLKFWCHIIHCWAFKRGLDKNAGILHGGGLRYLKQKKGELPSGIKLPCSLLRVDRIWREKQSSAYWLLAWLKMDATCSCPQKHDFSVSDAEWTPGSSVGGRND
jgi:hypothetical protein